MRLIFPPAQFNASPGHEMCRCPTRANKPAGGSRRGANSTAEITPPMMMMEREKELAYKRDMC